MLLISQERAGSDWGSGIIATLSYVLASLPCRLACGTDKIDDFTKDYWRVHLRSSELLFVFGESRTRANR